MRCPVCRKVVAISSQLMPFCSERCRLIDLGNWASEKYVISTPLEESRERQAEAQQLDQEEPR